MLKRELSLNYTMSKSLGVRATVTYPMDQRCKMQTQTRSKTMKRTPCGASYRIVSLYADRLDKYRGNTKNRKASIDVS